jgi:hypothetical protein
MSSPTPTPVSQPPPIYDRYQKDHQNAIHEAPLLGPPRNPAERFDYMEGDGSSGRRNDYWDYTYNNPERAECMRQSFKLRLGIAVVFIVVGIVVAVVVTRRNRCGYDC